MDRKYWTLLALGAAEGKALTPVKLQKTLFLLGQVFPKMEDFYNFVPYDYGPFNASIYEDAKILAQDGTGKYRHSQWAQVVRVLLHKCRIESCRSNC